jgi:hypothetical protein
MDQVEVGHGRHGYHKEVMLIFGVNEDCVPPRIRAGWFL